MQRFVQWDNGVFSLTERNNNESREVNYCAYIQYLTGCRISEVLKSIPAEIIRTGLMLVTGSKRSGDVVCRINPQDLIDIGVSSFQSEVGEVISRYSVYRAYKRMGIQDRFGNKTRSSVTHFFRQKLARDIRTQGGTDRSVASALKHKSIKSSKHYG